LQQVDNGEEKSNRYRSVLHLKHI